MIRSNCIYVQFMYGAAIPGFKRRAMNSAMSSEVRLLLAGTTNLSDSSPIFLAGAPAVPTSKGKCAEDYRLLLSVLELLSGVLASMLWQIVYSNVPTVPRRFIVGNSLFGSKHTHRFLVIKKLAVWAASHVAPNASR
jgi:hypothetical protein